MARNLDIEAVGPRNVRIFNTRGDLPAPHTPVGFKSIANFSTAIELKDMYPELTSYLLTPTRQSLDLKKNHIVSMRKRNSPRRSLILSPSRSAKRRGWPVLPVQLAIKAATSWPDDSVRASQRSTVEALL